MFILSFLTVLYSIVCFLTILIVLIQRGKSSMGVGYMGGTNQAIFGSSGGQDFFQKVTWIFLVIILGGSLVLSIAKNRYQYAHLNSYAAYKHAATMPDLSE